MLCLWFIFFFLEVPYVVHGESQYGIRAGLTRSAPLPPVFFFPFIPLISPSLLLDLPCSFPRLRPNKMINKTLSVPTTFIQEKTQVWFLLRHNLMDPIITPGAGLWSEPYFQRTSSSLLMVISWNQLMMMKNTKPGKYATSWWFHRSHARWILR